jgi:hypothetical protein
VDIAGGNGTTKKLNITDASTADNSASLLINKTGAITGSGYGVSATVSGASNFSGAFKGLANGTGANNMGVIGYGIGAATNNYGVYSIANSGTSKNYGVFGAAQGSTGTNYGGYFENTSTANAYKYGMYSQTSGAMTNYNYALYGLASGSTLQNIGVFGLANVATTGTNIGGVFLASAGTAGNYALITGGGNVGIGTLTPAYQLDVYQSTTDYVARIENNNNTTNGKGLKINAGSTSGSSTAVMIGFFTPADVYLGGITQSGTGSVLYNSSSDRRLKNNIVNTHFGITDLMKIQVRDYVYKADASKTQVTGFIAQELYDIFPNAVTKPANAEEMWSVDYGKVTPLLVKAIQEQQAEIEALKAKLESFDNLKAENSTLKAENTSIKTDVEALKNAVYGSAQHK